uniref:Uncharacterized protein n=1 Tax=Arundo donax TaxID=35708 RepID=A0A0A9CIT6_ARUDO
MVTKNLGICNLLTSRCVEIFFQTRFVVFLVIACYMLIDCMVYRCQFLC